MEGLVETLREVKALIHGCESLSVASTDGLILATTHQEQRRGEFLAAVTSFLLNSCAKGLAPYRGGECRALDYRGDRQFLLIRLDGVKAYLVCVLHSGAHAVNLEDPALRTAIRTIPGVLFGQEPRVTCRFFLQRDRNFRFSVPHGGLVMGSDPCCDLILQSPRIARRHLLLAVVGDRLVATDLDTEWGTRLNSRRFEGNVEVFPGDRLNLPGASGFSVTAIDGSGRELPGTVATKGRKKRARSS